MGDKPQAVSAGRQPADQHRNIQRAACRGAAHRATAAALAATESTTITASLALCPRSEQPCVRPVSAVHVTAGHNALRGSGPGQLLAPAANNQALVTERPVVLPPEGKERGMPIRSFSLECLAPKR